MPIHNWTTVDAGVFHDFHQSWIIAIRNSLNDDLLPADYYALAEQVAEGSIPNVVTLERVDGALGGAYDFLPGAGGEVGVAVAEFPPKVEFTHDGDLDFYADRASRIAIHHVSGARVVGYVEIISPGVTQQRPLGLSAYRSDLVPTAYFQPTAVGEHLIDMPVFLTPDRYLNLPLEATYQSAWKSVPRRWRDVVELPVPRQGS